MNMHEHIEQNPQDVNTFDTSKGFWLGRIGHSVAFKYNNRFLNSYDPIQRKYIPGRSIDFYLALKRVKYISNAPDGLPIFGIVGGKA